MPQKITTPVSELVKQAKSELTELEVADVHARMHDEDTVLIDIRDIRELQREGRIPGSHHCPRGMLEFWVDPDSPYYKELFGQDKTYIFFCAGGFRSALAAKAMQDMGLKPVAHMLGGYGAWKKSGAPVEDLPER